MDGWMENKTGALCNTLISSLVHYSIEPRCAQRVMSANVRHIIYRRQVSQRLDRCSMHRMIIRFISYSYY